MLRIGQYGLTNYTGNKVQFINVFGQVIISEIILRLKQCSIYVTKLLVMLQLLIYGGLINGSINIILFQGSFSETFFNKLIHVHFKVFSQKLSSINSSMY